MTQGFILKVVTLHSLIRGHECKPLKITRLKTAVVEANFDWTFVRIETDEGISGLGECFFAPGLTSILRSLESLLLGEDPRDVHRLFR